MVETLPVRRDTVIVGAGIVGCSTAYHLAKLGETDVAVVDQGPIPATGGSTVHAPAGVVQVTGSKTMSAFAQCSREVYSEVGGYKEVGGIEIAVTEEEWEFLTRMRELADSWGIEGVELLDSAGVEAHIPLVNKRHVVGGLLTPTDGRLDTIGVLNGLRDFAASRGITFHERTTVTDIETSGGAVTAVETDRGRIEADRVLVAANIWAPLIGDMVGVDIPLVPCEHQYAITGPLDELRGAEELIEATGFRYRNHSLYFSQHGEGYGIGSYNHEPLLVDPRDIPAHEDAPEGIPIYEYFVGRDEKYPQMKMPASREFTPEHFTDTWDAAVEIMPALDGAPIERAFNGMFCFTPDGMPVMGKSDVDGFWVAAAVWITQAGGVGEAMAEWLVDGYPEVNVSNCDINRFPPHGGSPTFINDRGHRQYDVVYDILHPRDTATTLRPLRRTPFYPAQQRLDAEFYVSAGWERVWWYGTNESLLNEYDVPGRSGWESRNWSPIEGAEHLAVRDGVGLYDLSTFHNIRITGPDALTFAQRVFANDIGGPVGSVTYTPMLNEKGRIIGDMTVVRQETDEFLVLANSGAGGTQQLAWIRDRVPADTSVAVSDEVSSHCAVGVWGPDSRKLLSSLTDTDLSNEAFPYFSARDLFVGSVPATALRVSYVGELGWELHAPTEYGARLWDILWEAGQEYAVVPFGDGALDSMRLEKGYRLWNADINNEFDPLEAGLRFAVDFDTDFVGKEALLEADDQGPDRQLSCLTLDEPRRVVMAGTPITDGDDAVGYATSAGYGYTIDRGIVYGYLPVEYADSGRHLKVEYDGDQYPATVREEPLFDPERERLFSDRV